LAGLVNWLICLVVARSR